MQKFRAKFEPNVDESEDAESGIEMEEYSKEGGRETSFVSFENHPPVFRRGEYSMGQLSYPMAPERVLGCLYQNMVPRRWCLKLVQNPWFDRFTMFVILLNCVCMAMYKPCEDDECNTWRCHVLQILDYAIFAYFALEMVIHTHTQMLRYQRSGYRLRRL